jgi:hypothetical protein
MVIYKVVIHLSVQNYRLKRPKPFEKKKNSASYHVADLRSAGSSGGGMSVFFGLYDIYLLWSQLLQKHM